MTKTIFNKTKYSTSRFINFLPANPKCMDGLSLKEFCILEKKHNRTLEEEVRLAEISYCRVKIEWARFYFSNASYKGSSYAKFWLAYTSLKNLIDIPRDAAFDLFLESAENGFIFSMYFVAMMYAEGKGCKKSVTKAKEWIKKALENDPDEAYFSFLERELCSHPETDGCKSPGVEEEEAAESSTEAISDECKLALPTYILADIINHDPFYSKSYYLLSEFFSGRDYLPTKEELLEMTECAIDEHIAEMENSISEGTDASESLRMACYYRDCALELFEDFDESEVDFAVMEAFEEDPSLKDTDCSFYCVQQYEEAVKNGRVICSNIL